MLASFNREDVLAVLEADQLLRVCTCVCACVCVCVCVCVCNVTLSILPARCDAHDDFIRYKEE